MNYKEYFDRFMNGDIFYQETKAELERRVDSRPYEDAIGIVQELMYEFCCTKRSWLQGEGHDDQ